MSIISYRIKHDTLDVKTLHPLHPAHESYRQPNSAWASLRKHYGLSQQELKANGWRVKLDVDEAQLANDAVDVAVEVAPMPSLMRRVITSLFGKGR